MSIVKEVKESKPAETKFEKFFINGICNIVLIAVVVIIFSFCYNTGYLSVFSTDSKIKPIYLGDTKSNKVTLMINVCWGTEYIDGMLAELKRANAKCTFFVGGDWASRNEGVLKKMYDEGHEIANHGYSHKDHKTISRELNYQEIEVTHKLVEKLIGYNMKLFAPPSGSFSAATLEVANLLGYKTIMWTRDTVDWRDKDENTIYSRAISNAKGGDLILMHPTEKTLAALPRILTWFITNNFNVTTVSDNIGL